MILKENTIVDSLIYTLSNKFGDKYTYYPEAIKEGFSKPCFSLYKIQELVSNGYQGSEYKIQNRDYIYIIRYFPENEINAIKEINEIKDELNSIKYINLINIEEDVKSEGLILIGDRDISTQESVLLYQITFKVNGVQFEEMKKVQSLELDVNI